MKSEAVKKGMVVKAGGRFGIVDILMDAPEPKGSSFVHVDFGNAAEWYHGSSVRPLTEPEKGGSR